MNSSRDWKSIYHLLKLTNEEVRMHGTQSTCERAHQEDHVYAIKENQYNTQIKQENNKCRKSLSIGARFEEKIRKLIYSRNPPKEGKDKNPCSDIDYKPCTCGDYIIVKSD